MGILKGFTDLERPYAVWLLISIIALVAFAVLSIYRSYRQTHPSKGDKLAEEVSDRVRKHPLISPWRLFMIGVFVSAFFLLWPVIYNDNSLIGEGANDLARIFKTILVTLHNVIKLFVVDSDFAMITGAVSGFTSNELGNLFSLYAGAFYIGAPIITAGFLLSFVKEFGALRTIVLHMPLKNVYIFSELNEMSLALARDIAKQLPLRKRIILFTDVYESDEESEHELITKAKSLGAKCLKRDIALINPWHFRWDRTRKFYCIGLNQDENVKQALKIIAQCTSKRSKCNNSSTEVYVFATSAESEILLDTIDNKELRVRRINENKNIVYKAMREYPVFADVERAQRERLKLLNQACADFDDKRADALAKEYIENEKKIKEIKLAIIGLGGYGTELLKTLSWLCQVEGYYLTVHIFDGEDGEEKIKLIAPELVRTLDERRVGNTTSNIDGFEFIDGEANYNFVFHNKTNVNSQKFFDEIKEIGGLTSVYVTLGNDNLNVQTAMKIRSLLCEKSSTIPAIYSVVFNSLKTDMIKLVGGLKTHKGEPYNITFIGDLESTFTLETIEQKEMEESALKCHMYWSERWEDREVARGQFKRYEYFRRASMAQALYYNVLAISQLKPSKNDDDLVKWEHARWNAYMRSEGYIYGKSKNTIMKTHKELVPFHKLSKDQWEKDLIFADGVLEFEIGIEE